MNTAVLIACHNRKENTIGCLLRILPHLENNDAVFVVDDGSIDGTVDGVNALEDNRIHIIQGNGSLFWAKGMHTAWEAAVAERADWGGFLWLNDDTELDEDAVQKIQEIDNGERIVVGDLANSQGETVYGLREGGLFTGNCVLVPRKVYERLGIICGDYSHAWADSDYAMRAKRAGIEVVSAGVVGRAEGHPNRPSLKGRTLGQRIKLLTDPKGWNLHDLWLYRRRNWGYCAAIASCAHMLFHVLIGER